jgi:SAM-dependent methyltransferase
MTAETTVEPPLRRSFRSRVSVWIWAGLHIHVVLRRLIAGVYAAEDAKKRVGQLEEQFRILAGREEEHQLAVQAVAIAHAAAIENTATIANATEDAQKRLGKAEEQLREGERRSAALEGAIKDFRERADALTMRSNCIAEETQALNEQLRAVRSEILFQQRRLTKLVIPAAAKSVNETAADILDQRFDSFYAAFQDIFRGSREDIKGRLLPYVDRLAIAGAGQRDKPIVDIGCGSGEWLEILKEKGLHAYGVDINTVMVERSVSLGLDARLADAMAHLRGIEEASCSGLTAFHVVEHLPFPTLVDLLDEAFRVVIPGGVLILETPNPETMRVGATTFYYDPTHRNPLMPGVLEFLVKHRGFVETEIIKLHPFTQGLLEEKTADAAILNAVLFGAQDYAVIARRP